MEWEEPAADPGVEWEEPAADLGVMGERVMGERGKDESIGEGGRDGETLYSDIVGCSVMVAHDVHCRTNYIKQG